MEDEQQPSLAYLEGKNLTRKFIVTLAASFALAWSGHGAYSQQGSQIASDGFCVGAFMAAKSLGFSDGALSANSQINLNRIVREVGPSVDRWASVKNACTLGSGNPSLGEAEDCIDRDIKDRNSAEFWKAFVRGNVYVNNNAQSKGTLAAQSITNTMCLPRLR